MGKLNEFFKKGFFVHHLTIHSRQKCYFLLSLLILSPIGFPKGLLDNLLTLDTILNFDFLQNWHSFEINFRKMQELVQIFVRLLLKPNCVPLSSSNICRALAQLFSEFGYFRMAGDQSLLSVIKPSCLSLSYSHLDFQSVAKVISILHQNKKEVSLSIVFTFLGQLTVPKLHFWSKNSTSKLDSPII